MIKTNTFSSIKNKTDLVFLLIAVNFLVFWFVKTSSSPKKLPVPKEQT